MITRRLFSLIDTRNQSADNSCQLRPSRSFQNGKRDSFRRRENQVEKGNGVLQILLPVLHQGEEGVPAVAVGEPTVH